MILSNLTISDKKEDNLALFFIGDNNFNFANLKIHQNSHNQTFQESFEKENNQQEKEKLLLTLIKNFFLVNNKLVKNFLINKCYLFEQHTNEEIFKMLKENIDLGKTEIFIIEKAFKIDDIVKL